MQLSAPAKSPESKINLDKHVWLFFVVAVADLLCKWIFVLGFRRSVSEFSQNYQSDVRLTNYFFFNIFTNEPPSLILWFWCFSNLCIFNNHF